MLDVKPPRRDGHILRSDMCRVLGKPEPEWPVATLAEEYCPTQSKGR